MEITDFLLARIAEDEALAKAAQETQLAFGDIPHWAKLGFDAGDLAQQFGWRRVLAECEAKRRIVDMFMWKPDEEDLWDDGKERMSSAALDGRREAMRGVLFWLTHSYVGHTDYDRNWRPGS